MILADFTCNEDVYCFHCAAKLPAKSAAELSGDYVVILCPECDCMTPFKTEELD